jgi:hypothetical protein
VPGLSVLLPPLGRLVPAAYAASPEPSAAAGDPRSNGQGPGLVGTPGLAILAVAAIAIVTVIATTIYVRLTNPPSTSDRSRRPPF